MDYFAGLGQLVARTSFSMAVSATTYSVEVISLHCDSPTTSRCIRPPQITADIVEASFRMHLTNGRRIDSRIRLGKHWDFQNNVMHT
jgi:hypothetical protein